MLEITGGGILYEPNEPDKLSDAIEFLLLNPERSCELGKQGREIVLERFNVDYMASKMVKAMETVIAQKSPNSYPVVLQEAYHMHG